MVKVLSHFHTPFEICEPKFPEKIDLLIFAKCYQEWDGAIPNYYKEAREDDDLEMAKAREYTKLQEKQLKDCADEIGILFPRFSNMG